MKKSDCIFVGLKLFGVYSALHGAIVLVSVGFMLISPFFREELGSFADWTRFPRSLLQLLQPAIYLLGAFLLIRKTAWCYRIVCPEDSKIDS